MTDPLSKVEYNMKQPPGKGGGKGKGTRGRDSGNGKVHRDGLEILGESGTLGDPEGQGHGGT